MKTELETPKQSDYISKAGMTKRLRLEAKPNTINGWLSRYWQKGVHYIVIGHTTLIYIPEVEKWLEQYLTHQESDHLVTDLESGSGKKAKSFIPKLSPVTPAQKVVSKARLKGANT